MTANDTSRDRAFRVRLASDGREFVVPPESTIVEVLREHGVDLPTSCEHGLCGTCLTRVVEGTPDHRDYYLTNAERQANELITPCCSRATGDLLVLDI